MARISYIEENDHPELAELIGKVRAGRRGTLIHYDSINHMLRGRRGARLTALTSGGTIPDTADYQVLLEPENQTIGSVNEDFAVESLAGDIFQLGNTSVGGSDNGALFEAFNAIINRLKFSGIAFEAVLLKTAQISQLQGIVGLDATGIDLDQLFKAERRTVYKTGIKVFQR